MKKRYIFAKTIWQIVVYLVEVIGISILLAYLTTFIEGTHSSFDFIERCIMCYTIYQILVLIILTNINDIERDSVLAYITNLEKCLLYVETKKEYIKEQILENINEQLADSTLNNNRIRQRYKGIKDNIEHLEADIINIEIINAKHIYEMNSLNWRFSFLLRIIK